MISEYSGDTKHLSSGHKKKKKYSKFLLEKESTNEWAEA